MTGRKIVFAGVAQDVAQFVPPVRHNIEGFARGFAEHGLILVESDSRDGTRAALRSWADAVNATAPGHAMLVEMEALAAAHPRQTDRIAICRNRYLQAIAASHLRDFDYLAVFDMDTPNAAPLPAENFMAAVDYLETHEDVAGVFANQAPVYSDIWALREKDWCPGDCWKEVATSGLDQARAIQKHVHDRQVFIDPARTPIAVESAFGGLAIYKLKKIRGAVYSGLNEDSSEVSEHVAFHKTIRDTGATLAILPFFLNVARLEHTSLPASHAMMVLNANGKSIQLLAGRDHPLVACRTQYPLYDERFPSLAALYSRRGGGSILDIGANIGDGLALARLHGCTANYLCVEGHEPYFMLLCANSVMHHRLFEPHRRIGKFARFSEGDAVVTAGAGTASLTARSGAAVQPERFGDLPDFDDGQVGLIKLDTDGNDAAILLRNMDYLASRRPILWVEAEARDRAGLNAWFAVIEALSGLYSRVILFDNFGFAIGAGAMDAIKPLLAGLLRYTFNHHIAEPRIFGTPTVYYLDVAFFADDDEALYEAFLATLRELQA